MGPSAKRAPWRYTTAFYHGITGSGIAPVKSAVATRVATGAIARRTHAQSIRLPFFSLQRRGWILAELPKANITQALLNVNANHMPAPIDFTHHKEYN